MKRFQTWTSALCASALLFCSCTTFRSGFETAQQVPPKETLRVDAKIVATGFAGDSQHLAILCDSGKVYLWDIVQGEKVKSIKAAGKTEGILSLGSGTKLAVLVPGGVQVWDTKNGRQIVLRHKSRSVPFVVFNKAEDRLAVPGADGSLDVWSLETGAVVRKIRPRASAKDSRHRPRPIRSRWPGAGARICS